MTDIVDPFKTSPSDGGIVDPFLPRPTTQAAPPVPKLERPKRTWGEAAEDTGRGVMSGLAGIGKTVGDLYGLATGDMDNGLSEAGRNAQVYWQEGQSDALKAKKAERSAAIDRADSLLGKAGTAIAETITDPALLGDTLSENVASFVPSAAAGRAGAAIVGARELAKGVGKEAAAKAATRAGTAAAVGTGAVQQGGDVAGGSYETAMGQSDEQWAANPTYAARVAAGEDAGQVKHELALAGARLALPGAAAVSVGSQFIPGGATLEKAVAGAAAKAAGKTNLGSRAINAATGAVGEGLQEAIEEGGGQFVANLAQQQYADPNGDLSAGVGESAGMGFVGGAGMGGVVGGLQRPTLEQPAVPTQETPPTLALPPPGAVTVDPQGTAITPQQAYDAARADAAFAAGRAEAGLTPDVNAARGAHPAAASNLADPFVPSTPALPAPDGTLLSRPDGTLGTPSQLAQQGLQAEQQDVRLAQWREGMGLTPDVNTARSAHPGAAPNAGVRLPGGAPLPNPAAGVLSRVVNTAAATGAIPTAPAAGAARPIIEGTATRVDRPAQAMTPGSDDASIVSYLVQQARAGGRTPGVSDIVKAYGLKPDHARELRKQAVAALTAQSLPPKAEPQTSGELFDPLAQDRADLDAVSGVAPREAAPVDSDIDVEETRRGLEVDRSDRDALREALAKGVSPVDGKPIPSEGFRRQYETELANLDVAVEEAERFLAERDGGTKVAAAAAEAATSPVNDRPAPTEAQKDAGNYKKGHVRLNGHAIAIENPAGTSRRPEWPPLANHYGYFKGTVGKDKDHVDVFMTDRAHDATLPVFVVDQVNPKTGRFDEHKVIMGAATEQEARTTYNANYAPNWRGLGGVTQMTQEQFKAWVKDPAQTKRRASHAAVTVAEPVSEAEEAALRNRNLTPPAVPGDTWDTAKVLRDKPVGEVAIIEGEPTPERPDGGVRWTKVAADRWTDGEQTLNTNDFARLFDRQDDVLDGQATRVTPPKQLTQDRAAPKAMRPEERHAKIDADFAANREAVQAQGFKKGVAVKWTVGDATRTGTIVSIDKDQGIANVEVEGARGMAQFGVGARLLVKADTTADTSAAPAAGMPETAEEADAQSLWRDIVADLSDPDIAALAKRLKIKGKDVDAQRRTLAETDEALAFPVYEQMAEASQIEGSQDGRFEPEEDWDYEVANFPAPAKSVNAIKTAGAFITPEQAAAKLAGWKAEAKRIGETEDHSNDVIISLFDATGEISKPWREAGYDVRQYDIKLGDDLLEHLPMGDLIEMRDEGKRVVGVIAQPPCTCFTSSGARWWNERHDVHDREMVAKMFGRGASRYFSKPKEYTRALVAMVDLVVGETQPLFHLMENPVGRIATEMGLPKPTLVFDPHVYGNPYTKRTQMWGRFNPNLPTANVEPTLGSLMHKLWSTAEKDGGTRSITPEGFAYAFFMANKDVANAATNDGQQDELDAEMRSYERKSEKKDAATTSKPTAGKKGRAKDAKAQPTSTTPVPPPSLATDDRFAGNTIFTADKVEAAKARLRAKLGTLNSGLDPELLVDGMTIAGGYIESGVRSFTDYAQGMVADLGEAVKPYLLSFYEAARHYPGLNTEGMDDVATAARAFDALITPQDVATEAVGNTKPAPRKRAKAKESGGDRTLRTDWPADHIDGYTPMPGVAPEDSDYGLRNGVKAEFLKDARAYLKAVADALEAKGFTATTAMTRGKAKALPTVSVNEAGPAVSGDVMLHMLSPDGTGIYVQVGATALRGVVPTSDAGVSIMYRTTAGSSHRSGGNQWGRLDLTAADFAETLAEHVERHPWRDDSNRGALPGTKAPSTDERPAGSAGSGDNQTKENPNDRPEQTDARVDRRDPEGARSAEGERGDGAQPRPAPADSFQLEADQPADDAQAGKGRNRRAAGVRGAATDVGRAGRDDRAGDGRDGRARAGGTQSSDAGAGSPVKAPAEVSPANAGPGNFHIDNPLAVVGGGQVARFEKNKAAIELFNQLRDESRQPTREEQTVLAGYTGWGSFGQELFQGSWGSPRPKAGWEARDTWLRENLGQSEWESVQRSITNAHYTDPPTVLAMWDMVKRMGFTGGRVLEPSMGIGNFFGMMPQELQRRSQLAGIELDSVTGGMAQRLYPDANIRIMGYQDSKTPDGFYDLVIGNWPFENTVIADRRYQRLNPFLHDYFFLKALDQTRAGGLVVGITSKGTMDKKAIGIRAELAKKGELVAAFRLPSGAFEEYAGTKVVTDIIILRKRETPSADVMGAGWIEAVEYPTPAGEPVWVNEYFVKNPQHVIGTIDYGHGTTFRQPGMIVHRPDDMQAQLARIVGLVPEDGYRRDGRTDHISYITNHTADREGSLTRTDAGFFIVRGEHLAPAAQVAKYALKDEKKTADREAQLGRLIDLRKLYATLIDAERGKGATEQARTALREAYQAFTKAHGPINASFGLDYLRKIDDPFYPALAALEAPVADKPGTYRPATILSESTTRGARRITKPSITDAFVLARNSSVNPSLAEIAALAAKPEAEVKAALIAQGAIFELPGGDIVPSDVYLSGNVREKLRNAQAAVAEGLTELQRNVEALQAVVPADVPYYKIETQFGATWVSTALYREYVGHLLGLDSGAGIEVSFSAGRWRIRIPDQHKHRTEARTNFGTAHVPFQRLVNAAISNQSITVRVKDRDGTEHVDVEATKEVTEKLSNIRTQFGEWLWSDSERQVAAEREYNEARNAYATPQFDGSFLSFQGMALSLGRGPFDLREHQRNAIWRALVMRKSINAHEVGTGKTFTMGGIAVESRRYGIAQKPVIFAHNANSKSVAAEIQMMYPAAKVLYVDNLSPGSIDIKLRQIANDDWDAVVLPHSLIDRLSFREDTLMALAAEEIRELEMAAEEAAQDDGVTLTADMLNDEEALKKLRSPTAKDLVKMRNRIINTIKMQAQRSSREGAVAFEDLGIDMVLVDEAHEFKKPPFATKMKMKGLQTQSSAQSIALSFITKYVRSQHNGNNVHLFTGTPVTNTMTEVFHVMRYVMQEEMEAAGVDQWDGWFGSFAREVQDVELNAAAEYEAVTRLAAFINVPELRRMVGQYMDVVFSDDMPEMRPRRTKSGKGLADKDLSEAEHAELLNGRTEGAQDRPYKKVIVDTADLSPDQKAAFEKIQGYARTWRNMSPKDRKEAMLKGAPESPIIYEGLANKASLDARLLRGEALAGQEGQAEDSPESKASRAVAKVLEIYNTHPDANQVIFTELGISTTATRKVGPVGARKDERYKVFSTIHDMIERLVAGGIPREQIALVDGSTSKDKRKEVADKMNRSEIRVVIGSTASLGVGVNMQRNLRAMHHLDAPWMPGDLEQRNGRGHRQGNQWNTVLEFRYLTDRLDGRRWQVLAVKDRFIKAFLKSKGEDRVIEGEAAAEEQSDILQTFAEAAGDPRILIREKLKKKIESLQSRERMHARAIADSQSAARGLATTIERNAARKAELDKAGVLDAVNQLISANAGKGFSMVVDGKTYTERKDANEALGKWISANLRRGSKPERAGTFGGFEVSAEWGSWNDAPNLAITVNGITIQANQSSLLSLESTLRNYPSKVDELVERVEADTAAMERLRAAATQPFHLADQLKAQVKALADLERDIDLNPVPPPAWLRTGSPIDTEAYWNGKPFVVSGHRWTGSGWFVVASDARGEVSIPYDEATDAQGMPLYEAREFEAPTVHTKEATKPADGALASTEELDFDSLPPELQASFRRQAEKIDEDKAERELAAQMSREDGEADADRYGLREAVNRLLGPSGLRVQFLRGYDGLPEGIGEGADTRFEGREIKTAGLYDPTSQTVYLFTHVVKDPNRAAWHAAHEIAGHDGLRKLLGAKLDAALRLAGENATVAKLADAIAKDRGLSPRDRLLAIEEALSELAAAVRTENFNHIQERYGVVVPQGIRAKVAATIQEFLRRLKNLLSNHLGAKFSDRDVRELLEAAWKAAQGESTVEDARAGAVASESNEAPFYSALHRSVIEGKGAPKKADAATWKGWLDGAQRRGEFRQGERDWLGLDAWLNRQPRSVTREDLAAFVRANAVQVEDVVLDDAAIDKMSNDLNVWMGDNLSADEMDGEVDFDDVADQLADLAEEYREDGNTAEETRYRRMAGEARRMATGEQPTPTKFKQYTLPGGANYRELLLTLPNGTPDNAVAFAFPTTEAAEEYLVDVSAEGFDNLPYARDPSDPRVVRWERVPPFRALQLVTEHRGRTIEGETVNHNAFHTSHFEQPNILAHVRFNERTDADGKRVLFLEEIQSDWHQAGRKRGYGEQMVRRQRPGTTIKQAPESAHFTDRQGRTFTWGVYENGVLVDGLYQTEAEAREEATIDVSERGVPDAPFKATDEWAMLAFKRMVRWAAEHGFDRIAWTTGEQQAERFDLSKQVSYISATRLAEGDYAIRAGNHRGDPVPGLRNKRVKAGELEGLLGKELAEKIIKGEGGSFDERTRERTYRGLDLKVGGDGMRGFYDKILPAAVNKWAKRFGAKVGRADVTPDGSGVGADPSRLGEQHSLDLTAPMREAALAGQPLFNTERPATLASTEDARFSVNTPSNPSPDDIRIPGEIHLGRSAFGSVKDWLGAVGTGKLKDLRPHVLASIPLNHLRDFATRGMHAVGQYIDMQYQMQAYRNKLYREYDDIAQDWLAFGTKGEGIGGLLGRKVNQAGRDLADLMHDSTVAGVDPTMAASAYQGDVDKLRIHRELRTRFDALPEQGQKLYARVRDAYGKQTRMIEQVLEGNLTRAMEINRARADRELARALERISESGHTEAAKDAERAAAHDKHDRAVRNSNQSVTAKIIGLRQKFEGMRVEQPYFPLKRFGRYFVVVKDARDGTMRGFSKFETSAEQTAFADQMRKQGFEVRIGLEADRDGLRDSIDPRFVAEIEEILNEADMPDFVKDEVWQAYLERLPDMSLRKSFIHRKKVQGYNPDALRAFSSTMFHGSYQLARLKYGMELGEALDIAEEQAKRVAPVEGMQLVNELRKRHEFILNPKGGVAGQVATTAAFVYHLGANPAHLFLNATQTAMIGVPVLGSRYGFGRTVSAIQKAVADFAKGKGHIERAKLTPEEHAAMEAFMDAGLIDKTQAHDLAGVGETGVEYSAVRQKVMNKLGWFFHQSERFNREVTALAAYRLARQGGDTHAQAISRAMRDTYTIHFDYSAAARPRWMQNDTAKVLLVFRNYNVNMLYRLFRDIHQSLRGESPQVRREARKQLGAMMGMYGLMAGTMGMPFYGLAMVLSGMFEDDDDPLTAEQQFLAGTVELLGPDVARVLLRGVPGAALNIDLSERIGMPNLWFRSPDRELEGRDAYYYWMEQLLGAAPALAKNVFDGLGLLHEGKVERGVEKMLPAFLRSPVRAARFATEGATTLEGAQIADIGAGGVLAQALGYTPLDLVEQYDKNSVLKGGDSRLERRRRRLMDRYFVAAQTGDADGMQEATADIMAYNQRNPAYAITRATLRRSEKLRERNRLLNKDGIVMTRRMLALSNEVAGDE